MCWKSQVMECRILKWGQHLESFLLTGPCGMQAATCSSYLVCHWWAAPPSPGGLLWSLWVVPSNHHGKSQSHSWREN